MDKDNTTASTTLAHVVAYTLSQDVIAPSFIKQLFELSDNVIEKIINFMIDTNIIAHEQNGWHAVIPTEFSQVNPDIIAFLNKYGYTESDIMKSMDLPEQEKVEKSKVLDDHPDMHDVMLMDPPENVPLLIRIRHKTKQMAHYKSMRVYVEDYRVGIYDGTEWTLVGPFPKYEFSILSDKEKIVEDAMVTHWEEATEELLHAWSTHLCPINEYSVLQLNVDAEHEKEVYDGLVISAAILSSKIYQTDKNDPILEKLYKAHSIMCDLQAAIDLGGINNAVEEE